MHMFKALLADIESGVRRVRLRRISLTCVLLFVRILSSNRNTGRCVCLLNSTQADSSIINLDAWVEFPGPWLCSPTMGPTILSSLCGLALAILSYLSSQQLASLWGQRFLVLLVLNTFLDLLGHNADCRLAESPLAES